MRLYPSRPSLPPPAAPTRAYPSSLTDAEWAVLAPLVQRPASPQGGRPPSTRCARSSTRSATWSAPAAPGGCWPTSSHPRARCMGGLPSGPPTAPWPGCTIPCPSRSASRRVATLFPRRRSSTPSRCGRPTRSPDAAVGGMPARRATAASGTWRWTPWVAACGHGHRRQHPGPRRGPGAAVAPACQLPRCAAVLGRWRVCRQAGRLGCGGAAPGVQIVRKRPGQSTFEVLPRRWVVERTLAWIARHRRTVRDYVRLPDHHAAMVTWAMVVVMTRRLARSRRAPPVGVVGAIPCGSSPGCCFVFSVRLASRHPGERHELDSPRELAAMSLQLGRNDQPHCWIRRSRTS
jgi:transposase